MATGDLRRDILSEFQNEAYQTVDAVLYDSLFLATASAQNVLTFFQNTIGNVTGGRIRTNMKASGTLPSPQAMLVTEIGYKLLNTDGTSFYMGGNATAPVAYPPNVIAAKGFWDFVVTPSTEYEGHLSQFREQVDFMNDGASTSLGTAPFPNAMNTRVLKLKEPIVLLPNRSFSLNCTVTTPAAAAGYSTTASLMYWYLKGRIRRNA